MGAIELKSASGSVTLVPEDGAGNANVEIPRVGVGKVLQVVNVSDNIRRKFNGLSNNTWHNNYTSLDISITPMSPVSKLVLFVNVKYGHSDGTMGSSFWRIKRDGILDTVLNGPEDSAGFGCFDQNRWTTYASQYDMKQALISGNIVPSSGTATTSFTLEFRFQGAGNFSINRDGSNGSDGGKGRHSPTATSSICIMEVL